MVLLAVLQPASHAKSDLNEKFLITIFLIAFVVLESNMFIMRKPQDLILHRVSPEYLDHRIFLKTDAFVHVGGSTDNLEKNTY
jgi:hypothetical protein